MSRIYATEQDKIHCAFYYKIGSCRHGDKCGKKHVKPDRSNTIILQNMYLNPDGDPSRRKMSAEDKQKLFDEFYQDLYCEAASIGPIEDIVASGNTNEHLMGNAYVRFRNQDDARRARDNFNQRWFAGKPVYCDLSPVADFREACCRQNDTHDCNRGNDCNFIHPLRPSPALVRELEMSAHKFWDSKGRERSPSPDRQRRRY